MEDKDKKDSVNCHFSIMKFKDKAGLGLKGISKYDQAFLEELDIHKTKNTDLAKQTLVSFCTEKKVPYKLFLENGKTSITIYSPK